MTRTVLRYAGALWLLQAVAGALAQMLYDVRLLAIPLSVLYLAVALGSARSLRREHQRFGVLAAPVVAVLWQLPALLGSINQMREQLGWTLYDGNSDLLDFAMETWQLALMPLLGLFPGRGADQLAGYYIGLTLSPVLLTAAYWVCAAWPAGAVAREEADTARRTASAGGGPPSS